MITPAFGLTSTERVLPKLALDFTTATLDPRVTFTRSGATATRVASNGYVTSVAADTPRFDYDPVTLVCKGLLIEEARTNLYIQSNQFDFGNWAKFQCSVTANQLTSPDGTNNADLITEDTSNNTHNWRQTPTVVSGQNYTESIYVKAGTCSFVCLYLLGAANYHASVVFDLSVGAATQTDATAGALTSHSITNAGNGWYRCTLTALTSGTTIFGGYAFAENAAANTFTASGVPTYTGTGRTLYIWGAQLEAGAFATSYIPTTTTALTRNTDVATMTGTNFSDWFNASEGTFYIEGSRFAQGTFAPFFSANNGTLEIYATQISNVGRAFVNADGGITCNGTWNTNVTGSMAFAYKANDMAGSFEGTTVVTDTTVTMFTADRLRFGNRAAGTNQLSGYLVKMSYWPSRLTNAEIQAFSK